MAPSTARRTRRRQPKRTNFKKKKQNTERKTEEVLLPTVLPCSCHQSSQDSLKEENMSNTTNSEVCSTPKGQKFMIPEISTCPPAPKKPRVLSNCSLRRSPLSFFAPPDLELFFFVAHKDVSV